jgi:hypothetical protein
MQQGCRCESLLKNQHRRFTPVGSVVRAGSAAAWRAVPCRGVFLPPGVAGVSGGQIQPRRDLVCSESPSRDQGPPRGWKMPSGGIIPRGEPVGGLAHGGGGGGFQVGPQGGSQISVQLGPDLGPALETSKTPSPTWARQSTCTCRCKCKNEMQSCNK